MYNKHTNQKKRKNKHSMIQNHSFHSFWYNKIIKLKQINNKKQTNQKRINILDILRQINKRNKQIKQKKENKYTHTDINSKHIIKQKILIK